MRAWHPDIDPATIPDEIILSERARRNAARRETRTGGRNGGRPPCQCGACPACERRKRARAPRGRQR